MAYIFEPYDILQIQQQNGEWLDFSTIRTLGDAELAVRVVDTDGASSAFETARFRIVAMCPQIVKHIGGPSEFLEPARRALNIEGR